MIEGRTPRRIIRAEAEDADRPLGDFLARHCPEVPVGFLNKLLRKGFVAVDGEPADERVRLKAGWRVALYLPEGAFLVAPNPQVPFRVVYEDEALVVINKPAGVVSEPGIGHKLDTLLNGLVARYGEALDRIGPEHDYGMAHRLDRDTSGLLVVARNAAVHGALVAQFRGREVEKRYAALVVGRLPEERGEIRLPLGRVRRGGRAVGVTEGPAAQRARTSWRVVERFADAATRVVATLHTGRWRQIRLHFAALGHPVAGDPEEGDLEANRRLEEAVGLRRMFLHAQFLAFRHPVTAARVSFDAELPGDLQEALAGLRRLWSGPRSANRV